MNPATNMMLQRKVSEVGSLPAIPSILRSLGECLSVNASEINIERIAELISYDKSLAAQCLRMANSALFRRRAEVRSVREAVQALGVQRIRGVVYSCSLPKLFANAQHGMAPDTFWRHALGTALISQHLARFLAVENVEKLYLAGLLHDIGILVNSLLFREDFQRVLATAQASETPLCEVEQEVLGFTHCDSGRILADIWKLPPDISGTIEFHHCPSSGGSDIEMTSVVYLADLLCRMRGLGYGYYEAREFDLASEGPWQVLQQKHPAAAAGLDLARFTFELDQYAIEVQSLVNSIFANGSAPR